MELWQGDCLELMNNIQDKTIDCIICDPPYGITACKWDSIIDFKKMWEQYNRILKDNGTVVLFSSNLFTFNLYNSNPNQYKYKLIWKKNVPTGISTAKCKPMKYYEEIMIFQKDKSKNCTYNPQMKERIGEKKQCYNYNHYCGDGNYIKGIKKKNIKYDPNKVQPSDVLEFNVVPNASGKLHTSQKPIELLEWLVKTYSNEGDIVLDNCMGSGTCGVACKNLGRDFIGIEKDETYFNIAKERIEKEWNLGV